MTNKLLNIDHHEFIETIFANRTKDEHICVCRAIEKKDGSGVYFRNHLTSDRAWRNWDPSKQDHAWYFCVSTVNGELNANGTMVGRGRANLMRAHCLVLDDIGTKATPPPSEPSWKIETSLENFQWGYLLNPPIDQFDQYEALVEHCHKMGWGDKGAGGSYRLMRVPGSANLKPGRDNFPSTINQWGC
jgi:hypothetical protein